ncbi:exodeoxyribonuclease V subunit alpha [Ideonella sp.]|uniref:exodeoxyribonuclease V subunit alpha n=1 Tax=Ideonella sp. TaxID=1929293 RepID=UPI003BB6A18D
MTGARMRIEAAHAMLANLEDWAERGWLRRLDLALARFMAERDPEAPPALLLAAALLAQMEGRGHTCLALASLVQPPLDLLAWPAEAAADLHAVWATLPGHLADWEAALRASPVVRCAAVQADAGQPLVLAEQRLYLRRHWDHEREVAAQVIRRIQPVAGPDEAVLHGWLDALFGATAPDAPAPDWQKLACAVAMRGRLTVITGGPGTGKTYTAARLLALLFATAPEPERLRVALAAPTGKAAARLKQSIDGSLQALQSQLGDLPASGGWDLAALTARMGGARTLHALLGARPGTRQFGRNARHPLDVDVLIVDEASMIHLEMMAALLAALPDDARLILLGDKDQLASVEAGAVLGDLCRDAAAGRYSAETARFALAVTGAALPASMLALTEPPALAQQTVMLRESRRFGGPIGLLAAAVNRGDAVAAGRCLASERGGVVQATEGGSPQALVQLAVHGRPGAEAGYRHYLQAMAAQPAATGQTEVDAQAHRAWVREVLLAFDRCRVLCAVRSGEWGVDGLNRAIEAALAGAGWLQVRGHWYAGRPVMVTRNDAALGVFNGDIGLALPGPSPDDGLRVWFSQGEGLHSVAVSRLVQVETAYAMTVHKAQGSEFEHTVLVLPEQAGRLLSRELVYTGITRARQAFSLVSARPGTLAEAVGNPTDRVIGLSRIADKLQHDE